MLLHLQVGFNVELCRSSLVGNLDGLGDGTHEVDINGTRVGSGLWYISFALGSMERIQDCSSTSQFRSCGIKKEKRHSTLFLLKSRPHTGPGPKWSTGQGGAGYTGDAKAYFIGGGPNTTMAIATATVSGGAVTGFDFTGTGNTRGANFTHAPQVVITSGGWRLVNAAGNHMLFKMLKLLGATDGFVIVSKEGYQVDPLPIFQTP